MKKIVVKIGSSSLTNDNKFSRRQMLEIVRQISHLHQQGHQITMVSSGAIAAGQESLSNSNTAPSLPHKQMLASVGQVLLMELWSDLFRIYDISIGQILLTRDNITEEKKITNAQNTLLTLLAHRVIPIVNENDCLATEEIQFGDNDMLSALVAHLIEADLLILLTDQEGLYTFDPRFHPEAKLIERVDQIDETILRGAQGSSHSGSIGTGGMSTKIEAARLAIEKGTTTVIASSKAPNVLLDLIGGKKIGTLFPKKDLL